MHNRSVSDPEINLRIYNMLQRVMVCLLCGSHFGRRYSKALDLIVAQPVVPSDEASVSSSETDEGKRPTISTGKKSRSFTATHMVSCFNHQRPPAFPWKICNHLQGKRRTVWGRLKGSRRRKVRHERAYMGGFCSSNGFPFFILSDTATDGRWVRGLKFQTPFWGSRGAVYIHSQELVM